MLYNKIPKSGDPSSELQNFSRLQINLLCTRYWIMDAWEHADLSFPYWRLYWNSKPDAKILFQNKTYNLTPDELVLIPPYTSYSTHYDPEKRALNQKEYLDGSSINDYLRNHKSSHIEQKLKHLFIHFTLGLPYDSIIPHILTLPVTPHIKELFNKLIPNLKEDCQFFNRSVCICIYSLILEAIGHIHEDKWLTTTIDYRINKVVRHIEKNITFDLSNPELAKKTHMSTNAFSRLFTQEMGISPQKYVLKTRIDKACILLHNSSDSIDIIVSKTGFCDRFYFSRAFKKQIKSSPAFYRKRFKV